MVLLSGPFCRYELSGSGLTKLWYGCPQWQPESFYFRAAFTAVQIFVLLLPDHRVRTVIYIYIYIYMSECIEIAYKLPLLPNNTANVTFYKTWERCEVLYGFLRSCDRASWHVTVLRDMWPCIVTCDRASWHVTVLRDMWPCILTNFSVIKSTRCTNFTNLFCHETLHVSDSSSVRHQEFIHCTLSSGVCHRGL